MMLLYADVYCQSNCLSVPGCQVLRGVIHNNNRAKAESGHWTGHLKKPVRDLGKFPTHHRSPAHPILSSALLQVAKSQITLRRTVYKQYSVVNLIFKRLSGFTGDTLLPYGCPFQCPRITRFWQMPSSVSIPSHKVRGSK